MAKILIIDDEQQLRGLLARIIGLEGYEVAQAPDCAAGLKMLRQYDPDVVLCDVKLPDGNGVEMVGKIKETAPSAEVILLTAYGNIPDGVQAIKNGAFDYITKGDDNNKILPLLSRAAEKAQMQRRLARFEEKLSDEHSFDRIIGSSEALRQAVALARKVAATNTSVLLTGETGTGKEVFAQAIHHAGPRAKESFVAVNCSAFSKELLESELFGHRAGSFTGASKDKKGLFEEADRGTLFLDEIGEMPVELQAKLLRVLESGEFIKIGETRPTKVDLRIIAATNRDLEKEIAAGNFREDLFFRLSVFRIQLPSLNGRKKGHRGVRPPFRGTVRGQDGEADRENRRHLYRRAGTPHVARQRPRTAQHRGTEHDHGRGRHADGRYASARIPNQSRTERSPPIRWPSTPSNGTISSRYSNTPQATRPKRPACWASASPRSTANSKVTA